MNRIVAILGISTAICAVAFFVAYRFISHDTVVIYDGERYTPAVMDISLGETVTFRNESSEPFWPASNLHPSHLVWSDFDPKQPVDPGEEWSFTFTQSGEWGYHDHIKPTIKGLVRVAGGETARESSGNCEIAENKQKCWEDAILQALKEGGVDGAFDLFTELYESDPEFALGCHSFVHLIGERSYEQFVDKESFILTEKTQFCGYGFFHGFMETLLIESGDIELSREFCTYVDEQLTSEIPSAWKACYHGIGHGAIDGGDPRDWGDAKALIEPGLLLCDKVGGDDFQKHLCGTGVFNGIALGFINSDYGLTKSKDTVFDLCASLDDPLYKPGCYDQMNTLISDLSEGSVPEALRILDTMTEREYYENALVSLASTFGHAEMSQAEYDQVIGECGALPDESYGSCIAGFVTGLIEYGPPGREYELGLDFCASGGLNDTVRGECYNSLVLNSSFIYSPQEIADVCDMVSARIDLSHVPHCTGDLSTLGS